LSASMSRSFHVRNYLPQSIAATTLMMAVPLGVVWVCSEVLYFNLPAAAALFVSLAAGVLCSAVATQVWERRSHTAEVSFSELMIWSWYRVHRAERRLERGLREAQTADTHERQLEILYELSGALESKDPYTRGHSKRVERYSFLIAGELGMPVEDVFTLKMSAALHDVGKIEIPNKVLHKPGKLNDEEWELVKQHPVIGSRMVGVIGDQQIIDTVRHHHERWDGGGYPDGISGTDIPLFSRIIAVADSYDAIRSARSYRPGSGRDEAVVIITEQRGHQYDPEVVDAFMATLPSSSRVAAAFMGLTGPGAIWRFVWQLFQRFGSSALAPALGSLGAAFVIVSSTLFGSFAPAVASPVTSTPGPPIGHGSVVGLKGETPNADARAEQRAERRAELRAEKRAEGRVENRIERRADERRERREKRNREEARAAGGSGSQNGGTSTGAGSTSGSGTSSGTNEADHSSVDDPNADKGSDCEGKSSKGSRLHCN
jgi:uncharacterized membrane protein YgcG